MDRVRPVRDADAIAVLGNTNRLAVLRRILAGEATISQVGREMGRHPAWVRHHVKALEAAGFVELASVRTTGEATRKFYRATGGAFHLQMLVTESAGGGPLIALGSNDLALEILASADDGHGQRALVPISTGSLDGLIALRQGLADLAGAHLLDVETHTYNTAYARHLFPDLPVTLITLAEREQGLVVSGGNPLGLRTVEDLWDPRVRFANRNPGSGTRVWLEQQLRRAGFDPSCLRSDVADSVTHGEIAQVVGSGAADVGIAVRAVAESAGLGFVPLFSERYDLVFRTDRLAETAMSAVIERLTSTAFRSAAGRLAGYDTSSTGSELRIA